ncbi:MAG: UDP-3-O-acyl-N-acetylglucosamine deacetylase [Fibrobacteres bacterium]|nr:UDP-3-O-acyl-N-acetylglucosamine deacetylase [Fibrobacterota bacterium]
MAFSFSGIGYHTGRLNRLRFQRARRGGAFIRIGQRDISLRDERLSPDATLRCTRFGGVGPLEHLLAAVCVLGVDGWILEAQHEDLPLFDGSALAWQEAILATGPAGSPSVVRGPDQAFECSDERGWFRYRPSKCLELEVGWTQGLEGPEVWRGGVAELSGLLKARTFVRSHEFVQARSGGYLAGADACSGRLLRGRLQSPSEILLAKELGVDPAQVAWTGGVPRMAGECAAHKALDLLGDLQLRLGGIPQGKIEVQDAGHSLHLAACDGLG